MNYTTRCIGKARVIVLTRPEFDAATARTLLEELPRLYGDAPAGLAIDLSSVEYISGAGLCALFKLSKQLGGRVVLFGCSQRLLDEFRVVDFTGTLRIKGTKVEAVEALHQG
jgi:anti-anti-sigma factor